MLNFKYSARDKDGKLVYGIIEAVEQNDAIINLQSKGLVVVSVSQIKQKYFLAGPQSKKLRRSIKPEDLAFFCRQMSILLSAGVTLLRSLSILLKETTSRPLCNALEKIKTDIEEGNNLHNALAKHPKIFHYLWISMIEAGETSGQLSDAFSRLAVYLERSGSVMRKVKGSLVYPAILLAVCIAAILIFMLKVIPMFGNIYKGFNIELPALTVIVISFSKFMQRYIIFILVMASGIIYGLKIFVSKTLTGRIMFDTFKLNIPLFGPIIRSSIIERFAHGLSTLIKSGIPILTGLDIIAKSCGNKIYEDAIISVKENVRTGKSMSTLLESSGLFPSIVTQMINIGEETGRLSDILDRVANYYQEKMDAMVDVMTTAFEPLLLIFMGVTVGTLVIAMYLPIFKIASGSVSGP